MKHLNSLILLFMVPAFGAFAQNTCATALPITAGTHTVDTIDGTEIPDPICAQNGAGATNGEWYVYTPTQDYTVTLTTDLVQNTGGDTRVHVYTGTCGALVCHDGDDDGGSLGGGFLSYLEFPALQGTTYYIAFDDKWSDSGFDFELSEGPYVEPQQPPVTFTPSNIGTITGDYQICVVDMNGDYLDDIVTVASDYVQLHYQQAGGGFTNTTINHSTVTFPPGWSMAAGDIDKDGFNDLVYGNGSGVTFMYATNGGTGFNEVSGPEYVFSQRTNFIDLNNDGHLDAFVCHDVNPNVYYMNDGSNNLQYYQGGIGDHPEGGNYGSIWTDIDNDGDMDMFIAKCRGGQSTAKINELFRNDGNGVFTSISASSGMDDPIQTWSSAWNDFDNDGYMDAAVGASSTADGTHKLMQNNGDNTFDDVTAGSGWDVFNPLSREHVSFDFDNDGFADVFGGSGTIMFNDGDMTFTPHSYGLGSGPVGDLNNDGFLDIQNGGTVYYNSGNSNNWVKFSVQGVESNGNGIGTRVEIYGDWGKQIRDVRSGQGFAFMHTLNVHFGIGDATEIDSVYVKWPTGKIDVLYNPDINEAHTVVEGSNPLGLLDLANGGIGIYPNPTTAEITISQFDLLDTDQVAIYTYDGRFMMEITSETTNVKHLSPGRYIVRLMTNDGKHYAATFVKQ